MTEDEFYREKEYQICMRIFRSWFYDSLITETEYIALKEKMKNKYNPVIGDFLLD